MTTFAATKSVILPVYASGVPAGFPSPADDHLDGSIDLNTLLVENPAATFVTRASGNSMEGAGIYDGDLVIVNRALTPVDGSLIVAEILGDFTLKRLRFVGGKPWLYPENPQYDPIQIKPEMGFSVWGIVKHTIRIHKHGNQ